MVIVACSKDAFSDCSTIHMQRIPNFSILQNHKQKWRRKSWFNGILGNKFITDINHLRKFPEFRSILRQSKLVSSSVTVDDTKSFYKWGEVRNRSKGRCYDDGQST